MNREIKFRAWNVEQEYMVTAPIGVATIIAREVRDSFNSNYGQGWGIPNGEVKKGDYVLMQFTGLKDKNGKEIYEGDIVEWDDRSNSKYWRVALVRYDPDIRFEIINNTKHPLSTKEGYVFDYGSFAYKDTHNHLEIIGNIYQNPELIKLGE